MLLTSQGNGSILIILMVMSGFIIKLSSFSGYFLIDGVVLLLISVKGICFAWVTTVCWMLCNNHFLGSILVRFDADYIFTK